MTFKEWYLQIQKEMESTVPTELVREVLVTGIRVALEEFMANRAEADLDIGGVGRFYLNHRVVHNPLQYTRKGETEPEKAKEYSLHWTIQFKPSLPIKKVINDKMDMRQMLVGGTAPLYPEFIYAEDGMSMKRGRSKKFKKPKVTKSYRVRLSDKYMKEMNKAMREEAKKILPDKEE